MSWNAVSGATSYNLYENGSASNLGGLSRSYTKTSANTFVYEVSACNSTGCSSLSAGTTVTVSAPPPTPISLIGFDAEYKGYWPTSSSTNDLYIVRQSSDNNYEGVSDFILEEQLDGSYSLNANPTSGQIAAFNLTTPASIGYELFDVNLDGAIDMILMDSTDTATGFVYAATISQSAPIGYKHIDSEFIEFFEDIYPGIEDPNYYKRTAKENNWGTWEYGSIREGFHNTDELFLSGQYLNGVMPFYTELSEAYDPTPPAWCSIYPLAGGQYFNGVWIVYGIYQDLDDFYPDYSHWNEDALIVVEPVMNYLAFETSSTLDPLIGNILEDILGVNHELDDEPAIFNLVSLIGKVLFGFGVEQEVTLPNLLTKVELLYTDIGLPALPPFARHAYLQVTYPNGNIYVTRAGPEQPPSFGLFGNIDSQWATNALVPITIADFKDLGKPILFRQLVGHITLSEAVVLDSMDEVSEDANSCTPYILLQRNSNTYAFQSVPLVTGLPRPKAMAWAPGANGSIPCL